MWRLQQKQVQLSETAEAPSMKSFQEDLAIPSGTRTAPSSAPPMHQERETANQESQKWKHVTWNEHWKAFENLWALHDFPRLSSVMATQKRIMAHDFLLEDQLLCIDIELESDEERETKNGAGQLVDLILFISNLELVTVSYWPRSQAGVLLPGTTGGVERWPYFQHAWHPLRLLCPDCNLRMSQEPSWVHVNFYFYFARLIHGYMKNEFWIIKHFADIATLLAKMMICFFTTRTSEHSAYTNVCPVDAFALRQGPAHHTQLLLRKGSWHSRGHACRAGKAQAHPLSTAKVIQSYPNRCENIRIWTGFLWDSCRFITFFFRLKSLKWGNFMKIAMLRFDEQVSTNSCGLPQICCWKLRADRIYLRLQIPIGDNGIIRSWM